MSEPDVVAELDHWLDTEKRSAVPGDLRMMQRARDEILALRTWRETVRDIYDAAHFEPDSLFEGNALARRIVDLIEKRHADYFLAKR